MQYLEIFNSGIYIRIVELFPADFVYVDIVEDISLTQWLALTPPELVKAHLGFDDATIASLNKTKQMVVGPR